MHLGELIQLALIYFTIFGIPILSLIRFAVSLAMFLREKDPEIRKKKKVMMIVSACVAGVFVVCLASFTPIQEAFPAENTRWSQAFMPFMIKQTIIRM